MEYIYQLFGRHKFNKITTNLDLIIRRFNEVGQCHVISGGGGGKGGYFTQKLIGAVSSRLEYMYMLLFLLDFEAKSHEKDIMETTTMTTKLF